MEETIVAIATAMGEGGIGILRISGPQAKEAGQKVFRLIQGGMYSNPEPRRAVYGKVVDPENNEMIDEALFLYMPGPHSYTAEDVVELHLHGSAQSLKTMLEILLTQPGLRLAEPGEFTQRAFINGRLDLSQAEAVIDVIRARTDRSLKAAVGQMGGALSQEIQKLSRALLDLVARLEVVIEYPEDSLEETEIPKMREDIQKILAKVTALRESGREGRILREGLATAIVGLPNVGKSSLLNFLLGEERAIVTEIPGTTRDVIEEYLSLGGIPLRLIDTAGIRETEDKIEQMGIDRSRKALAEAQFVLFVLDGSRELSSSEMDILKESGSDRTIVLINKQDISSDEEIAGLTKMIRETQFSGSIVPISAQTGEGSEKLIEEVKKWVHQEGTLLESRPLVSNVRQIEALRRGEKALQEAIQAIDDSMPPDCILVDLREAWAKIAEVNGQAVSDEIITHIFSQFCLGK